MAGLFETIETEVPPEPITVPGTEEWFAEKQRIADEEAAGRLAPIYDKIDTISGMAGDIQSFDEWAAEQGVALQDWGAQTDEMGAIADRAAAGPTAADQDAAFGYSARMLGYGSEAEMNAEMEAQRLATRDDMTGIGDVEMQTRQRANQAMLREMEARQTRMVENTFADSGSTIRMLQAADEAASSINNVQLQQADALAIENYARRDAQLQTQKQQWQQQLQVKTISVQQYMQNLQQGMQIGLQGYAQEIEAIWKQNQQYLQTYKADHDAFVAIHGGMMEGLAGTLATVRKRIERHGGEKISEHQVVGLDFRIRDPQHGRVSRRELVHREGRVSQRAYDTTTQGVVVVDDQQARRLGAHSRSS